MALKSAYLTGILAHIPEAERGKAETELAALEAGGLKQEDYSRLANEATAAKKAFDDLHEKNVAWFEEKRDALAGIDALKADRDALAAKVAAIKPGDNTLPVDAITKADLEKTLELQERGAVGFFTELNALSLQHYKEFGEILDTNKLLSDKRVQQVGLRGVYAEVYKEPLALKTKAAQDARDEVLRKEGRDAAIKDLGARQPYPVVGNEHSALDAIEAARAGTAPVVRSVDDMAAEYSRLTGARSS